MRKSGASKWHDEESEDRKERFFLQQSVSVAPLTVRSVVVIVHLNAAPEIYPAIGCEVMTENVYERTPPIGEEGYSQVYGTHEEMIRNGWEFQDRWVHYGLVYCHPKLGVQSSAEGLPAGEGRAFVASCPWDPIHDAERLALQIQDATDRLRRHDDDD